MAYTKAGGVKVVSIDGATPSIQSVQNHSYPYWRPTFYYTNGEPSGIAKAFLDFHFELGRAENRQSGWLCSNQVIESI
jgi:ABC-type phosphate transport system substrate-binding protein